MILAIVFAELWAVCQLIVLGTFTRTVRVRTVFMAVAVGLYACAPLAVLIQVTWIHAAAWLTGTPAYQLVKIAAYTADPFIEEIIKLLPVALLLTIPAIRRQWSITDCVLLGAACGAGFGLAEELYMFGKVSTSALFNARFGGWMLPGLAATPTVPSLSTTVTSWLPPGVLPNELLTLSLNHFPAINLHLAWSAVGGLAIGLIWLRREWMSRIAGAILLLYVASDHALNNAHVSTGVSLLRNVLAVMPIVALGIAWWFDRRSQRSSDEPVLAAEGTASWRSFGTLQVAVSRLPGSLSQLFGFVRMRRAHNAAQAAGGGDPQGLRAVVVDARDRIERDLVQPESPRWLPIGWTRSNVFGSLQQPAVILRLVLMTPSFLWFVVGGWPQTAGVQQMLTGPVAWKAVIVLSLVSQAWLAWSVIVAVRAWPKALRLPIGDDAAIAGLRGTCGVGAVALGGYALLGTFTGVAADGHLYSLHVEDAFLNLTAAGVLMLTNGPIFLPLVGVESGNLGAALARLAMGSRPSSAEMSAAYDALESEKKAAYERAVAGEASAGRDLIAAQAASRKANAEFTRTFDAGNKAAAERDAILAAGDEARIYETRDLLRDAIDAHRKSIGEVKRADGALEGAEAADRSADAAVKAAAEAYKAAAKAHMEALTKARAAQAGGDWDKP